MSVFSSSKRRWAFPRRTRKVQLCWKMAVLLSLATGSGLLAGCGRHKADYSGLGLIDVSGVVTLDGRPLEGVTVIFEAADGQFSYGVTDGAGSYGLQIDSEKSGVTPGKKIVRVTSRPLSEEWGEEPEESAGPQPEKVPSIYNRESSLRVSVPSDSYDFALKTSTAR